MRPYKSEEEKKEQRMLIVNLAIALIIQIVILLVYFFGEKQTLLSFPMILGILISINALAQAVKQYRSH